MSSGTIPPAHTTTTRPWLCCWALTSTTVDFCHWVPDHTSQNMWITHLPAELHSSVKSVPWEPSSGLHCPTLSLGPPLGPTLEDFYQAGHISQKGWGPADQRNCTPFLGSFSFNPSPSPGHPSLSLAMLLSPTPNSSVLPLPLKHRLHWPQHVSDPPVLWPDPSYLTTSITKCPACKLDYHHPLDSAPPKPIPLSNPSHFIIPPHNKPFSRTPASSIDPDTVHTNCKNRHHGLRHSPQLSDKHPQELYQRPGWS